MTDIKTEVADEVQVISRETIVRTRPYEDGNGYRVSVKLPKPNYEYFEIGEGDTGNMISPEDMPALIACLQRAWELYQSSKEQNDG